MQQECVGGYAGAACGGLAYDTLGFQRGALVVAGIHLAGTASLPIFKWMLRSDTQF